MRTIVSIILTSIVILSGSYNSTAQTVVPSTIQNTLNSTDRKFIQSTAQGLIFEVLAGGIATVHTRNFDVKEFGERMIIDHRQDYVELTALATSLGVPIPTVTDSTHLKVIQKFNSLVGPAFDRTYINYEIQDHITDIHDYLDEVRHGKNLRVRTYASAHLTELFAHLQFARSVAALNGLKK